MAKTFKLSELHEWYKIIQKKFCGNIACFARSIGKRPETIQAAFKRNGLSTKKY